MVVKLRIGCIMRIKVPNAIVFIHFFYIIVQTVVQMDNDFQKKMTEGSK